MARDSKLSDRSTSSTALWSEDSLQPASSLSYFQPSPQGAFESLLVQPLPCRILNKRESHRSGETVGKRGRGASSGSKGGERSHHPRDQYDNDAPRRDVTMLSDSLFYACEYAALSESSASLNSSH